MRVITVGLLLFALGVVALNAHSVADVSRADTTLVASVAATGAVSDTGDSDVIVDASTAVLITVCGVLVVCCILLLVVKLMPRRSGALVLLALAPRGSPAPVVRLPTFTPRLLLSQLSISRT